jgi:hypothetical protein
MNLVSKYNKLPFLLFILVGLFFIYKAIFYLPHDFANYYYGATFLENGTFNTQIYDPTWFNLEIAKQTKNVFAAYAPNTPFLSLLFLPFTLFSFEVSKIIFNSISLFLFAFSIFRIFKFYSIDSKYILLLLVVFIIPIKNNLLFGQVYFLLFFLISEGYLAYKKKKLLRMSIYWSIAILLKVFPILLFLFLVLQKKWKALIYLSITLLILFLNTVFINGFDAWSFYVQEILPKASKGEISSEFVMNYQSFLMFFKHLFIDSIYNEYTFFNSKACYFIALNTLKLMVFLYGIYFSVKHKSSLTTLSYWIIATYFLSPYSSSYGSILLIFPMLVLLLETSKKKLLISSAFIFIYCNLKFNFIGNPNILIAYFKLFSLCIFFYGVYVFRSITIKKQAILLMASVVISSSFYFFKEDEKEIEISSISDTNIAFIIDYSIKNNSLFYTFWNENGLQTKKTDIIISSYDTKNSNIKKNHIYIDKKEVDLPKSNKKKAMIINNNTLVFLSDDDRGYGFYKLQKMDLNNHE